MGANQSSGIEIGGSSMGYQVLRVYPNGPGSRAGLKAYFDFIIGIGQARFNRESGSLREILKASVDQKLKMSVFNTRTKQVREVEIVPSLNWGGNGLLGISIKHTSFDRADERVWHVVEVESNSPAHQAGLKPNEDYVIGADSILQENDDLYNLIEAHDGKALKLFVYNINSDNCREVICHPNSRWGGRGFLGCEFGHGLLHRIPNTEEASENPTVTTPLLQQNITQHVPLMSNTLNAQSYQPVVNNQVQLEDQQYQTSSQLTQQHQQHQQQQQLQYQSQAPPLQSQYQQPSQPTSAPYQSQAIPAQASYSHHNASIPAQHQYPEQAVSTIPQTVDNQSPYQHQQQAYIGPPLHPPVQTPTQVQAPYQFSQLGQVSPPSPPVYSQPPAQVLPPPPPLTLPPNPQ